LSMSEIMDGAARSTVLLANATNADFGTAADVATDAMAQFNITAQDMAAAVNGITGVTTNSKFGIDDYRLALAQAGGVASAVGVDFGDFNTTIAAISPLFASGSDAGTSFKTFLQRLIPASNDAEAAMRQLGLITADGANQFFDASGNMRGMGEIAGLLQGALAGLSEEQKNAALATIFGTDAMRAAVGLAETGSTQFGELANSIAQVDAERSAFTRMDTLNGALEILQGIMDGLVTKIGDAFLPSLKDITKWAIDFADKQGPVLVAWFEGLAGWLTSSIPVFADWASKIGGAVSEVWAWLAGNETTFTNLRTVWSAVTGIVGGAVDAAIAYVRSHWQDWVNTLMEWGGLFASWAGTLWAISIRPGLERMWADLSAWLDTNAAGLGTKLGQWGGAFATFATDVVNGWNDAWPRIQTIVGAAQESITKDIDSIMESLGKLTAWGGEDGEGGRFKYTWGDFWTSVANGLALGVTSLMGNLSAVLEGFSLIVEGVGALKDLDFEKLMQLDARMKEVNATLYRFAMPGSMFGATLEGRAAGGPVRRNTPYWVGELGPELFVPQGNGHIVPNNQVDNSRSITIENVNLQGGGNAGQDVLSSIRLLAALYG